jgi:hypothetical protein
VDVAPTSGLRVGGGGCKVLQPAAAVASLRWLAAVDFDCRSAVDFDWHSGTRVMVSACK